MGSKDQRMNSALNRTYLLIIMLCLICSSNSVSAQETDTLAPAYVKDSTFETDEDVTVEADAEEEQIIDTLFVINSWMYPADSIKKIKQQKEFTYIRNLDSLLKARQDAYLKSQNKMEESEQIEPPNIFPVVRFLLWTIAIAAVLFIIYRLFLSERGLFSAPTKNKKTEMEEEVMVDDAYLSQQLQEAIRNKNYRLAIRYLYLQTLTKMAEKEWLILSPDKTNYQYVRELKKTQHKNEFARITLHYEYAWYGDFVIADDVFATLKKEFEVYMQKIQYN